ncbi:MAG: Rid family detoxifying hydrolase [Bacillota bacterium]|nr:Rid family detoxifying hydrolase [Bacillota bacterium]
MRRIYTADTVRSSGPYSHCVEGNSHIFISGQTALNGKNPGPKGDIVDQTKKAFENLEAILKEANLSFDNVLKVNVYLTSMKYFDDMNQVYKEYFKEPYPARTCVAVLELPLGADIEIELVCQR